MTTNMRAPGPIGRIARQQINRFSATVTPLLLIVTASMVQAQAVRRAPAPDLKAFDSYVAQAARDWNAPGLAIAIVSGDSMVFARGYGVVEMGEPAPANEHTRFAIGSTTKAMTSAALGMLVDEGKLRWDDRVIDHIPDFRLYDPYVTREITVRDLLTHRSGLPGTDLLWTRGALSAEEMRDRLRHVKPTSSFRSQFAYQNVVYAIGGDLIAKISGMPWDEFIRTRIFEPLGMTESVPLVAGVQALPNVAAPHGNVGGSVGVVPVLSTDAVASAGSVWSSVSDMAKWMRFMLDSGRVGDRRLLKPETFSQLVAFQIRATIELYPSLALVKPHNFGYGLGWFVHDYFGETVWMHTGSINGMSAIVGLMPDNRTGVVVLASLDHVELRHALMYRVFDMYAGNPERDWSSDVRAQLGAPTATARPAATRPATPAPPSLPLERYTGRYVDSTYGAVEIQLAEGALNARFGKDEIGILEPWEYETFRSRLSDRPGQGSAVTFIPDGRGNVASLQLYGVTFTREAPSR